MTSEYEWVERFPGLSRLEPKIKELLLSRSNIIEVPKGVTIFGPKTHQKTCCFF